MNAIEEQKLFPQKMPHVGGNDDSYTDGYYTAQAMKKIKKLLPKPDAIVANARQPAEDGAQTVLMKLISQKRPKEMGDYLIANGADLTATDGAAYTVLHWAAMKDDAYFAVKAIEAGVSVDQPSNSKGTALVLACSHSSMDVFNLLMERNADVTSALAKARDDLADMVADHDGLYNDADRSRMQEMIERMENAANHTLHVHHSILQNPSSIIGVSS